MCFLQTATLLSLAVDELWGLQRDLEQADLRAIIKVCAAQGEVVSTSELVRRSNDALDMLLNNADKVEKNYFAGAGGCWGGAGGLNNFFFGCNSFATAYGEYTSL